MKDYYKILGVNTNSPDEVIKAAYRALAKKYHPDIYQGDKFFAEQKMKEINEAYDILSDNLKRKEYDSGHNQAAARDTSEVKQSYSEPETQSNDIVYPCDEDSKEPDKPSNFIEKVFESIIVLGIIGLLIFGCVHLLAMIKGFLFPNSKSNAESSSVSFSKAEYEEDSPEYVVNSLVDAVFSETDDELLTESCLEEFGNILSEQEYPDIFMYLVNDEDFLMDAIHSSIEYNIGNVEYIDNETVTVVLNLKTISFYELSQKAKESADKDYEKLTALNKSGNYYSIFDKYVRQYYSDMDKNIEKTAVFTLKKESTGWKIIKCDDAESFLSVLSGNT